MWDKCVVLWGTHWEIEKHNWEHARTHWEHVKNTKLKKFHPCTPTPLPHPMSPREKKMTPLEGMYSHCIGHGISIPKIGCHHTWPELIPLFKRVGS
jgi:hypothetical protein